MSAPSIHGDWESLLPPDEKRGWGGLHGHMRFSFSPMEVGNAARISAFVEGAGIEVVSGDPRSLVVSALRFDAFLVARVRASSMHIRWARRRLPSHSRYMFIFVNHGTMIIEGDAERWESLGGGLAVVFPGRTPVDLRADGVCEMLFFTFDQREILPLTLTSTNIARTEARTMALAPIYAFLESLTQSPREPGGEQEVSLVLRGLTRDVARAVVLATSMNSHGEGLFTRAQMTISERCADPLFTLEQLAASCGVSRRTLVRAYSAAGRSASHELRHARTRLAAKNLTEMPDLAVDVVAGASGFGSAATMNRALSELYGVSVRTLRRASGPVRLDEARNVWVAG